MSPFAGARRRIARLFGGRESAPAAGSRLPLETVRRRLELLLIAVYGRPFHVVASMPTAATPWYRRSRRTTDPALDSASDTGSDAERIELPAFLDLEQADPEPALGRYRLLAFEQAERIARGSDEHAPSDDPLARDLYLLAEGAAVDAALANRLPGLCDLLARERSAALTARPSLETMRGLDREVEAIVRGVLTGERPRALPTASPAESLDWSRREALRIRAAGGRYLGVAPVAAWGALRRRQPGTLAYFEDAYVSPPTSFILPLPGLDRGEGKGPGGQGEESPEPDPGAEGAAEEGPEQGDSDSGTGAASDAAAADASRGAEEVDGDSETESKPQFAGEAAAGPRRADPSATPGALAYPEWDWKGGRYHARGALVREAEPAEGDEAWSLAVLAHYGGLVRRLREQFERLRARRSRLYRQRSGDELDLAACVGALVDLRAGHAVDDRLYAAVRPARREISILLLVDISGSTNSIVGNTRIIDIEKFALLLTAQALDALGDRYAVLTFSGESASNVRVRTVKGFADRNGALLRRRIAALRPEGYTRMGAAIRHATALLGAQRTAHQLLLILSDGKPNDSDHYEGRYGIEDSRQAIAEARAAGVHPFCLTVDRKGSEYLTRIFGESGHRVLRHAEHLPQALLDVVRHLLRR
jgi:nitric oxide reductase NorD protein